jgi:hypothetical protein
MLAFISLSPNKNKESIKTKSFVDTKWCVDDPEVNTSICFKSDNTFWHYSKNTKSMRLDSMLFCKWGMEKGQIYLFEDKDVLLKFQHMEIISCKKDCMILKYAGGNKRVKLIKKDY